MPWFCKLADYVECLLTGFNHLRVATNMLVSKARFMESANHLPPRKHSYRHRPMFPSHNGITRSTHLHIHVDGCSGGGVLEPLPQREGLERHAVVEELGLGAVPRSGESGVIGTVLDRRAPDDAADGCIAQGWVRQGVAPSWHLEEGPRAPQRDTCAVAAPLTEEQQLAEHRQHLSMP